MAALVPELVTSFLTADYLDPDTIWIGINQSMSSRFAGGAAGGGAGGATGDDVGGTGSSVIGAVGPVTSTAVVAGSVSNLVTLSRLCVCKLSTADVCPTDSPVILETLESLSEVSSAMSIIVCGPVTVGLTIRMLWAGRRDFS